MGKAAVRGPDPRRAEPATAGDCPDARRRPSYRTSIRQSSVCYLRCLEKGPGVAPVLRAGRRCRCFAGRRSAGGGLWRRGETPLTGDGPPLPDPKAGLRPAGGPWPTWAPCSSVCWSSPSCWARPRCTRWFRWSDRSPPWPTRRERSSAISDTPRHPPTMPARIGRTFRPLQYYAEQDSSAARWGTAEAARSDRNFLSSTARHRAICGRTASTGRSISPTPTPARGDIVVSLGLEGRLLRFRAEPPFVDPSTEAAARSGLDQAVRRSRNRHERFRADRADDSAAGFRRHAGGVARRAAPSRRSGGAGRGRCAPRQSRVYFETITPYDSYWSEGNGGRPSHAGRSEVATGRRS